LKQTVCNPKAFLKGPAATAVDCICRTREWSLHLVSDQHSCECPTHCQSL